MPYESQPFSRRLGYVRDEPKEITVREDAPEALVEAVINIATMVGGLDYDELLDVDSAMRLKQKPWEPAVVRGRDSSASNLRHWFMEEWPWFEFYDFVEAIYTEVKRRDGVREEQAEHAATMRFQSEPTPPEPRAPAFEDDVNRYFRHAGVGWQLVDGEIRTRGSEAFESAVHAATEELDAARRPTARGEIHEALRDLSRRPEPDLTGAAHHAMNSLECVARDVCGDATATLGEIVKRHPGLIPRPLDTAVEKAWGYASEMARHIREGREPDREEVELVVGLAATVATYLSRKNRSGQ